MGSSPTTNRRAHVEAARILWLTLAAPFALFGVGYLAKTIIWPPTGTELVAGYTPFGFAIAESLGLIGCAGALAITAYLVPKG